MLILLDRKKRRNGCSENREIKVGATSSEDAHLIIILYWPTFSFFEIDISICKDNHIRKSKKYNLSSSIADRNRRPNDLDRRADNWDISIADIDIDKRANNPSIGINIVNTSRKVNNLDKSMGIADVDKKADNSSKGIDIINLDKEADNLSTSTNKIDEKVDDLSI